MQAPTLKLPSSLESLKPVFEFIDSSLPEEFRAQQSNIELVAEELLVNVFSYAYEDGNQGDAVIGLKKIFIDTEEFLAFMVKDWGKPFNPFSQAKSPDLTLDIDERPIGGLGVFLIRQISDHQLYSYSDNCNTIYVFFSKIPKSERLVESNDEGN